MTTSVWMRCPWARCEARFGEVVRDDELWAPGNINRNAEGPWVLRKPRKTKGGNDNQVIMEPHERKAMESVTMPLQAPTYTRIAFSDSVICYKCQRVTPLTKATTSIV